MSVVVLLFLHLVVVAAVAEKSGVANVDDKETDIPDIPVPFASAHSRESPSVSCGMSDS